MLLFVVIPGPSVFSLTLRYHVSSGTVSKLNQKVYQHIEAWRNSRNS